MEIIRTASDEPLLSPFAPFWDFYIGNAMVDSINLPELKRTILSKEREIKRIKPSYTEDGKLIDGHTGLGKNSTTSRFLSYNMLMWKTPEIDELRHQILNKVIMYNNLIGVQLPKKLWIQCWVNVLRFGQRIKPHLHCVDSTCYLSGHYTVQCNDTSTVYISPENQINDPYEINVENKPGLMTIFPSYVPHYTTRHYSFTPRITIAFDIFLNKDKENFIRLL
jgi:hypothetical protein